MKLIIDIDEQHFELLQMAVRNGMGDNAQKIIAQGTPIPDNATNERIKDVVNVMLNSIRAEIEHLHYHPKLDFIKNDEVVEMALDIIDKYKGDKE